MLQKINLPIDFTGGIDTKTDPKLVSATELLVLENGVFVNSKTIKKRDGNKLCTNNLLAGGKIDAGEALGVYEDELLKFNKNTLYSYSESKSGWVNKGNVVNNILSTKDIINNSSNLVYADSAISGTIGCYAWKDSRDGVHACVIDLKTQTFLVNETILNGAVNASKPKCLIVGDSFVVLYALGGSLKTRVADITNPLNFASEINITGDLEPIQQTFDATDFNDQACVFAYATLSNTIKVGYILSNGTLGSPITGFPTIKTIANSGKSALNIIKSLDGTRIYIAGATDTFDVFFTALNNALTITIAPVIVEALISGVSRYQVTMVQQSASNIKLFFGNTNANVALNYTTCYDVTTTGSRTFFKNIKTGVPGAKAFIYDTRVYIWTVRDTVFQSTYYLHDVPAVSTDTSYIVAHAFNAIAGGAQPFLARINFSNTSVTFSGSKKQKVTSENGAIAFLRGVVNVTVNFSNPNRYTYAYINGLLHFTGGIMTIYDGNSIVENGFLEYPELQYATATVTTPGGGVITPGTYQYSSVYKWVDNKGRTHRSSPSIPLTVVVTNPASKVTLTVPSLFATNRFSPRSAVEIEFYRTEANGTVFYKIYNNGTVGSITYNNPALSTFQFVDNNANAAIISNEILYTLGGELPNDAPPSCKVLITHKNRLFGLDETGTIRYSKEVLPTDSVSFSNEFSQGIDPIGGEATALYPLDSNLVVFKDTSIYYLPGEGPLPTGEQNDFKTPQSINTDTGCSNVNSIVRTPDGLMFKSNKGIYLLTRSFELVYIGDRVEGFNNLNIVSADLLKNKNEIRFKTSDGPTLVYDYYFKQWSTFTNSEGLDAVIYKDTYTYLRKAGGQIYFETKNYFKDDNKSYQLKIITAWIKLSGIQNYQRVQRFSVLGDYKSPHKLAVSVAYDYQDNFLNTYIFDPNAVLDFSNYGDTSPYGAGSYGTITDNVYQFRAHLQKQKCESIKFKFEDILDTNSGEGYSISNLALQIMQKAALGKFLPPKKML